MALNYPHETVHKCFYKADGKLHQINVGKAESINEAITLVKDSLMKDSLPFPSAVLVSVK